MMLISPSQHALWIPRKLGPHNRIPTRPDISFLYAYGGISILVYTIFSLGVFGVDEVKCMFLNALLGLLGLCA